MSKLTPEQTRTYKALANKKQLHLKGQGPALDDNEKEWDMLASLAVMDDRILEHPYLPSSIGAEVDTTEQETYVPPVKEEAHEEMPTPEEVAADIAEDLKQAAVDEAIKPDVTFVEPGEEIANMTEQELLEKLQFSVEASIDKQGLRKEVNEAREQFGTIWFNQSNGIIFGYRSLSLKDRRELEEAGLESMLDEAIAVADKCVVINKEALFGKNPSAYVHEMVHTLVLGVSQSRPELEWSIKV